MSKKRVPLSCESRACDSDYHAPDCKLEKAIRALRQVSFYARINHGTKCKDYGEIVDPVLILIGEPVGEL